MMFPAHAGLATAAGIAQCPLPSHSMCGNSFHVGVQALLLVSALSSVELLPETPSPGLDLEVQTNKKAGPRRADIGVLPPGISVHMRKKTFEVKVGGELSANFDWKAYGSWQKALISATEWQEKVKAQRSELETQTAKDLRDYAKVSGLPQGGHKACLVFRILGSIIEMPSPPPAAPKDDLGGHGSSESVRTANLVGIDITSDFHTLTKAQRGLDTHPLALSSVQKSDTHLQVGCFAVHQVESYLANPEFEDQCLCGFLMCEQPSRAGVVAAKYMYIMKPLRPSGSSINWAEHGRMFQATHTSCR